MFKFIDKVDVSQERIKQLEFLLCKGEHKYVKTGQYRIQGGSGLGDEQFTYHCVCKTCGKETFIV